MSEFNQVLISSLTEMGFAEANVRDSVRLCNGDAAAALDMLLSKKEEEDEAVSDDDDASDEFTYSAVPVTDLQPSDAPPTSISTSTSSSALNIKGRSLPSSAPSAVVGSPPTGSAAAGVPSVGSYVGVPMYSAQSASSAGAAAPAPSSNGIIYSKIPDMRSIVYEELPPTDSFETTTAAKKPPARALARQESMMKLMELAEKRTTDQKASSELAAQLRKKLYTPDGKRVAPSAAPKRIPTPDKARAAAIEAAQSGALTTSSPMHVIHFAMLSETKGLPLSVNVFSDGKKYSKSFIGSQASAWIISHVSGVDAAKAEEICKKLVRGRFILQIDYKNDLRPYSSHEIYRLNPKSKLLTPQQKPATAAASTTSANGPALSSTPLPVASKPGSSLATHVATSSSSSSSQPQSSSSAATLAPMPSAPPASIQDAISDEMSVFLQFDWYHQRITKTVAEARVGTTPGNFLLRDSSQPGCLCITYVSAKRGVSHVLVEKINDRWTMKGAPMSWSSVPELLHAYRKVYSTVIAPPKRPALQRHAGVKTIGN